MGVFNAAGDIMSIMGDTLSTVGGYLEYRGELSTVGNILSTVGGMYHDTCGGISWVLWGVFSIVGDIIFCYLSTVGDIMIHVGDIMSTVGCSVQWRYSNY